MFTILKKDGLWYVGKSEFGTWKPDDSPDARDYDSKEEAQDRADVLNAKARREHLSWCKQRAIEYLDGTNGAPNVGHAMSSFGSDLQKSPLTADALGLFMRLGSVLMLNGHLSSVHAMREHIEGYN